MSEPTPSYHDLHIMLVRMEGKQDALLQRFDDHKKDTEEKTKEHDRRIASLEKQRMWDRGVAAAVAAFVTCIAWVADHLTLFQTK